MAFGETYLFTYRDIYRNTDLASISFYQNYCGHEIKDAFAVYVQKDL